MKNQHVKIDRLRSECEFRNLKRTVPDVKLITIEAFEFAVEIVVTSDISDEKSKLIHEFKLQTIRIDLTEFYKANKKDCQESYEFFNCHLTDLLTKINSKVG